MQRISLRFVVFLAVLAVALAGRKARASPVVGIYPLAARDVSEAQRESVEAVLVAVLAQLATQPGALVPRLPVPLAAECGPRPKTRCLARLAGRDRVLFGRIDGERTNVATLTLVFVDAEAGLSTPVSGMVDLEQPAAAVRALVAQLAPMSAFAAMIPPPASRPAVESAAVGPPVVASSGPGVLGNGTLLAAAGAALLVVGGLVGVFDRQVASALQEKFDQRTLTPADHATYAQVRQLNLAANVLFGIGGAVTAGGVGLWAASPDETPVQAPVVGDRLQF